MKESAYMPLVTDRNQAYVSAQPAIESTNPNIIPPNGPNIILKINPECF